MGLLIGKLGQDIFVYTAKDIAGDSFQFGCAGVARGLRYLSGRYGQIIEKGGLAMGINELFDGIAGVVEQFAEDLAEHKLQKRMSRTRRSLKVRLENLEKKLPGEAFFHPNFPKTG